MMKCLSIHQPWAELIISGKRKLEIRSWSSSHRGKMLIHAGLSIERKQCERLSIHPRDTGAIVGLVELIDTRALSKKEWEATRSLHLEAGARCYGEETYGWFLKNPERFLHPIVFRGSLGLFTVSERFLPRSFKILKDGKVIESFVPGKFAGWKVGKIFGRLDCTSGMRMKKENRVFFHSWKDAIAEGYRPCKLCKPTPRDTHTPQ